MSSTPKPVLDARHHWSILLHRVKRMRLAQANFYATRTQVAWNDVRREEKLVDDLIRIYESAIDGWRPKAHLFDQGDPTLEVMCRTWVKEEDS